MWGDSSSSGGSDVAGGGAERFLDSLMSLRRSSKSFGLDTAGTDFPAGTPEHVRPRPPHSPLGGVGVPHA